jgi:hypothetical protein
LVQHGSVGALSGTAIAASSAGRRRVGALQLQRGFIMKSLHAFPPAARLVLGTLTAVILLAAMSAVAASTPVTSDQFAPGWQSHAHALINLGPTRGADRDKWFVPAILPRGDYVLIRRNGDKAELIGGNRFTVTSDNARQYLLVEPGQGDVQALPAADVPSLKPAHLRDVPR